MSQALAHEDVIIRRGRRSGLPLIVAVHSRALGPAVGGCRLRRYDTWQHGLADALRLSEAMTYKAAVAGLDFGGGKSVIALDNDTALTPQLRETALEDLGELIASFQGSYRTGPDVGTGPEDMVVLRRFSPYAYCAPEGHGGTGNSGGPTATGVLAALRAGARHVFGDASCTGRTVVISGFGSVGSGIAAGLAAKGAHVVVSDLEASRKEAALASGYGWVEPGQALSAPADILVPAAVGGVLNDVTVPQITARLVVGPANNQLTEERVADALAERGIVWVPDYVASAGGIAYALSRESENYSHEAAQKRVEGIGDTVTRLLDLALSAGTTLLRAAQQIAERRLASSDLEAHAV
ncbi:Glu/Leu/Phe/Val dehydrogenase family protein [Streptomyces violaceusniger]|uniref:Valine dehydrogenase n=1 Tax=Streptomyces violaceusniger (strain Tu 4113) TaxID=653045 RepID=G2PE66_STRV4|nr:Glu/Leu/Phe/Val dehydrogenase dimerization domain-containing protein [Streptomyces violaceusniger]AEM83042.1 Glu/Leu/Phe/Val dehydrogenase dimerization region [Streptomyces violaceusniger Tu 4113]